MTDEQMQTLIKANFHAGDRVKNYQVLCQILDLPPTGGRVKQQTLANLSRFVEWERDGNSFRIVSIYDIPLPKTDKRTGGNHSIYIKMIETILLDYLLRHAQPTIDVTKSQLWKLLGMIGDAFFERDYDSLDFGEKSAKMKRWLFKKAYDKSWNKLNATTQSALDSLKKRKLIEYTEELCASINHNGQKITNDDTIEQILAIEAEALETIGCSDIREVIVFHKLDKFIAIRNLKLQTRLGFDYIYRRYHIVANRQFLERGLTANINELKQTLNATLIDSLKKRAELEYHNNLISLQTNPNGFVYPTDYVEMQQMIIAKIMELTQ